MLSHKKMTINATITSFRRTCTSPTTNIHQKVPCKWKFLSPLFLLLLLLLVVVVVVIIIVIIIIIRSIFFFFFFSSGYDRYIVENDDECCDRTFLDHIFPTLWKMLPILQFRLAVSPIGNEYLCRKQGLSISLIT